MFGDEFSDRIQVIIDRGQAALRGEYEMSDAELFADEAEVRQLEAERAAWVTEQREMFREAAE